MSFNQYAYMIFLEVCSDLWRDLFLEFIIDYFFHDYDSQVRVLRLYEQVKESRLQSIGSSLSIIAHIMGNLGWLDRISFTADVTSVPLKFLIAYGNIYKYVIIHNQKILPR